MTRQLISNTEVLAEMLQDPQFRAEWERTALARAVAEAVIRYRADRGLSQTALARLLGWRQPVVARLEAAEHNPTMDTLLTLHPHARPAGAGRCRPEDRRGRQGYQVPGRLTVRPHTSGSALWCWAAARGHPPGAIPRAPSQATDAASHPVEADRQARDPVAESASGHSNVSVANEIPGSQTGSQRPQA